MTPGKFEPGMIELDELGRVVLSDDMLEVATDNVGVSSAGANGYCTGSSNPTSCSNSASCNYSQNGTYCTNGGSCGNSSNPVYCT